MSTARRVEYLPTDELVRHPENPRRKRGDIIGSLRRFGFTVPILRCDRTGYVAAGHGRLDAVEAMRDKGEKPPGGVTVLEDGRWAVPVVYGWASADDAELYGYVIADNRQTQLGGWEVPELALMLTDMQDSPKGLPPGITPKALSDMMNPERPTVGAENSYDQRAEHYRNKPVRSFVFDYPVADYTEVTEAAAKLGKAYKVDSAAELFIALLREWDAAHPAPA